MIDARLKDDSKLRKTGEYSAAEAAEDRREMEEAMAGKSIKTPRQVHGKKVLSIPGGGKGVGRTLKSFMPDSKGKIVFPVGVKGKGPGYSIDYKGKTVREMLDDGDVTDLLAEYDE